MPPKAKYTREEIVQIALDLVSEKGIGALNARNLGAAMGTSTRPVFTAFKNMNELTEEVKIAAMHRFDEYAKDDPETGVPAFQERGIADDPLCDGAAQAVSAAVHDRERAERKFRQPFGVEARWYKPEVH